LCKCSVTVSINNHKDYYESVEDHISDEDKEEIEKEVFDEMVKRDTVITVQAYPDTPIGFYTIHHYDLEKAISEMLKVVQDEKR